MFLCLQMNVFIKVPASWIRGAPYSSMTILINYTGNVSISKDLEVRVSTYLFGGIWEEDKICPIAWLHDCLWFSLWLSLNSLSAHLLLIHCEKAKLSSLLFYKPAKQISTPGPLQLCLLPLRVLFSSDSFGASLCHFIQISAQL